MGNVQDSQQPVNERQPYCDQGVDAALQNPLKEQFNVKNFSEKGGWGKGSVANQCLAPLRLLRNQDSGGASRTRSLISEW